MPRDAYQLPLHEYLQLRLSEFMSRVRRLGLPASEETAKENFVIWEQEYHQYRQQLAA